MRLILSLARWRRPKNLQLWLSGLVLALVFSGTLGQLHRMVHAPGLTLAQGAAHSHSDSRNGAQEHAPAAGWLAGLFGIHNDVECQLYDQLSGDPALLALPLLLAHQPLPAAQLPTQAGDFIARRVAFFQARGPPRHPRFFG